MIAEEQKAHGKQRVMAAMFEQTAQTQNNKKPPSALKNSDH